MASKSFDRRQVQIGRWAELLEQAGGRKQYGKGDLAQSAVIFSDSLIVLLFIGR